MKRFPLHVGRWLVATAASLLIAVPATFSAAVLGAEHLEKKYYAERERPPVGEDDLGLGLVGIAAIFGYGAGTFLVVWPLSTLLIGSWLKKRAHAA